MESFLSGGIGVELVVDGVGSVLVEVFGATDPTSEENPASKARNLLDTKSLILKKLILLIIEDSNHWFELIYVGAYPIDSPHNIYYCWA